MSKQKVTHELIDNKTGEVLVRAESAEQFIKEARYYVLSTGRGTESMTYVVLVNGAETRARTVVSDSELDRLLYGDEDTWDDEGGAISYSSEEFLDALDS